MPPCTSAVNHQAGPIRQALPGIGYGVGATPGENFLYKDQGALFRRAARRLLSPPRLRLGPRRAGDERHAELGKSNASGGPPSGKLPRGGCGLSVVAGLLGSSPRPSPDGLPDASRSVKTKSVS